MALQVWAGTPASRGLPEYAQGRQWKVVSPVQFEAGVNFAEFELTKGDYKIPKTPPFIMGFEAAGVVVEVGPQVQ